MRRHVAVGRSVEDARMRADGNDRPNGELVWAHRQGLSLIACAMIAFKPSLRFRNRKYYPLAQPYGGLQTLRFRQRRLGLMRPIFTFQMLGGAVVELIKGTINLCEIRSCLINGSI
jgi:hypothetical protein